MKLVKKYKIGDVITSGQLLGLDENGYGYTISGNHFVPLIETAKHYGQDFRTKNGKYFGKIDYSLFPMESIQLQSPNAKYKINNDGTYSVISEDNTQPSSENISSNNNSSENIVYADISSVNSLNNDKALAEQRERNAYADLQANIMHDGVLNLLTSTMLAPVRFTNVGSWIQAFKDTNEKSESWQDVLQRMYLGDERLNGANSKWGKAWQFLANSADGSLILPIGEGFKLWNGFLPTKNFIKGETANFLFNRSGLKTALKDTINHGRERLIDGGKYFYSNLALPYKISAGTGTRRLFFTDLGIQFLKKEGNDLKTGIIGGTKAQLRNIGFETIGDVLDNSSRTHGNGETFKNLYTNTHLTPINFLWRFTKNNLPYFSAKDYGEGTTKDFIKTTWDDIKK